MARSKSTPVPACETSGFSFEFADTLSQMHDDTERTWLAMSSLIELLQGCDPDHQLSAGALLCLLDPIAGCMQTICGDVGMVKHHYSFRTGDSNEARDTH